MQIWHYYERFGRKGSDRAPLQVIVSALLVLSLFQVVVLIHRIYDIHVGHFGDFAFPLLTGALVLLLYLKFPAHCAASCSRVGGGVQLCVRGIHERACATVLCPPSLGRLSQGKPSWCRIRSSVPQ